MKHSSIFLLALVIVGTIMVVAYRYHQYMTLGNYTIEVNTSCNSANEDCFVSDCTEADLECDPSPYKKVQIIAHEAPKCLEEHTCEDFTCIASMSSCTIVHCSSESLSEGEVCATTINSNEPAIEANVEDIKK